MQHHNKSYVGKQEFHLLPKGLCYYILKLKVKVSGIAPDNTIYNLHKKTHEEKAVVCLIYILNQRKYSDICKFHHKYVSFDLKQKVVFKRRFLPSVSLIVL